MISGGQITMNYVFPTTHGIEVRSILILMSLPISNTAAPILRGYLHLACALVAPYGLLTLLFIADSPSAVVGGAIFGTSLIVLYSTSATYHLLPLRGRLRELMKRLDHAVIFLFIAGAYAPFALVLLDNAWGISVLSVVGGLAGVGFVTTLTVPVRTPWIRVCLYIGLGWVGIVAIFELFSGLPREAFVMLVMSGILFSLGGMTWAIRRPNPFPRVFGYHEVFHVLQTAATAVLYSVVAFYVLSNPPVPIMAGG